MDIFESLENLPVSEACFEDIVGLVEEYINERNKENREAKKQWEISRTPEEPGMFGVDTKRERLQNREGAIRALKRFNSPDSEDSKKTAKQVGLDSTVDTMARDSRVSLGREQNEVSLSASPKERNKRFLRKEVSQRGSSKDKLTLDGDPLRSTNPRYKYKKYITK